MTKQKIFHLALTVIGGRGYYYIDQTAVICEARLLEYFPGLGEKIKITVGRLPFEGAMRGVFVPAKYTFMELKTETFQEYILPAARTLIREFGCTIYFKVENEDENYAVPQ